MGALRTVFAVVAAVAAPALLYIALAATWFSLHDEDSVPIVQGVVGPLVLMLASVLLAFVGASLRRSALTARVRGWLPVVATLGTALGVAAVAVPAPDLPEPIIVLGALGLGAGLVAAFTMEWRYGVLDGILVAFAMFLAGVGVELYN